MKRAVSKGENLGEDMGVMDSKSGGKGYRVTVVNVLSASVKDCAIMKILG